MNCQQINWILDDSSLEALAHEDRRAVDRHFASCRACRESWSSYARSRSPRFRKCRRSYMRVSLLRSQGTVLATRGGADSSVWAHWPSSVRPSRQPPWSISLTGYLSPASYVPPQK
jgi:predicted anti-sigma-YlaC factor YlaD